MLILTRRQGESIIVTAPDGTRIEVTVTKMDRNRAHIGIQAPRNWDIDREEIDERKRIERESIA